LPVARLEVESSANSSSAPILRLTRIVAGSGLGKWTNFVEESTGDLTITPWSNDGGTNQNVGIATTNLGARLSVLNIDASSVGGWFKAVTTGLYSETSGTGAAQQGIFGEAVQTASGINIGVRGHAINGATNNYGVYGLGELGDHAFGGHFEGVGTFSASTLSSAGVYGKGSGAVDNYGVYGTVNGGTNSTSTNIAVYGITTGGGTYWAAYFAGRAFCATGWSPSDSTLKTEIHPFENALDQIDKLKPKSYIFKNIDYPSMGLPEGTQYGFLSQDLKTIYPQFVTSAKQPATYDSVGNVINPSVEFEAVNISAMIPVAIEGIRELKAKNDGLETALASLQEQVSAMQSQLDNCCSADGSHNRESGNDSHSNSQAIQLSDGDAIVLDQNVPNPFAESTTITWQLPANVKEAKIIFTSPDGRVIREVELTARGFGELKVYTPELSQGMYSYSLIADGKTIDTKKMVKQH